MLKRTTLIVFLSCCGSILCTAQQGGNQDAGTPGIEDGRSDYRYANSVKVLSADKTCSAFEPQYVKKFNSNKPAMILPGDTVSVFLKKVYFGSIYKNGWSVFGNSAKEAAILLNSDINAPSAKKSTSDYGKLIYYADSLSENSPVNQSFSPVATIALPQDSEAIRLEISVVQFSEANSPIAKGFVKTLLQEGASNVNPLFAPLLGALGSSIVGADSNGGTRTTNYKMGFILGSVSDFVRQPLLREGDIVLVTTPKRTDKQGFKDMYFEHTNGLVFVDAECNIQATDLDYLVLSLRKGIHTGIDSTKSQTLADAIDVARQKIAIGDEAIISSIAADVRDTLVFTRAREAVNQFMISTSNEIRKAALKSVVATLYCSGYGNPDPACGNVGLIGRKSIGDLQARLLANDMLCEKEISDLLNPGGAAPTSKAAMASGVSGVFSPIWARVTSAGSTCP